MRARLAGAVFAIVIGVVGAVSAFAAERVVLTDGRDMIAEARREVDGGWLLELRGGGIVSVPVSLVDRFEAMPQAESPEPGGTAAPTPPAPDSAAAAPEATEPPESESLDALIERIAAEFDVDAALVESVVWVESGFDPFAVSPKGAAGLMQLMPATAKRFEVEDVFDPTENIRGGVRYLKVLTDRFDGDLGLVLASYNAGEGAVQRYGGVPPYRETQRYVIKVLERYLDTTKTADGASAPSPRP